MMYIDYLQICRERIKKKYLKKDSIDKKELI